MNGHEAGYLNAAAPVCRHPEGRNHVSMSMHPDSARVRLPMLALCGAVFVRGRPEHETSGRVPDVQGEGVFCGSVGWLGSSSCGAPSVPAWRWCSTSASSVTAMA